MNPHRVRLINAARKALFQRAQIRRSSEDAKANFAPNALKKRVTSNVVRGVDDAVAGAERGLRRYSLPLGVAALAGLAYAFRRPLGDAAHAVADTLSEAASAVTNHLVSLRDDQSLPPLDDKDDSHEPV